jgi:hypothetical protein
MNTDCLPIVGKEKVSIADVIVRKDTSMHKKNQGLDSVSMPVILATQEAKIRRIIV